MVTSPGAKLHLPGRINWRSTWIVLSQCCVMEEYDENGADRNSIHIYITLHYIRFPDITFTLHHEYITLHGITFTYIAVTLRYTHYITFTDRTFTLHCIPFHCMALHCITLHYIYIYTTFTLHWLHYITSHLHTLHLHYEYVALHFMTFTYINIDPGKPAAEVSQT
jgi:hypothetical protein